MVKLYQRVIGPTRPGLWEHDSYTSGTLLGPNWLRGPWPFLLYKMLYNTHASPRAPCVALQLYSAIQYTGIHRYTLHRYTLYNNTTYATPLWRQRDRSLVSCVPFTYNATIRPNIRRTLEGTVKSTRYQQGKCVSEPLCQPNDRPHMHGHDEATKVWDLLGRAWVASSEL